MSTTFQKKKEDFVCEKCGAHNVGDGFTNHCSQCLWSKHVDVHPGDRAETCGGLMEPTDAEYEGGEHIIIHTCKTCGAVRRKKVEAGDNFDTLVAVVKKKTTR